MGDSRSWAASKPDRRLFLFLAFLPLVLLIAAPAARAAEAARAALPRPEHVVIVVEENHSYTDVLKSKDAPYFQQLAEQGANFVRAYAIEHPSQPNYLDLFSGANQGVTGDGRPHGLPFSTPNLGAQLREAGFSFVGYSDGLPEAGYNGNHHHAYARKHNPWVNWQDKANPASDHHLPPKVNQPLSNFPKDFADLPTLCFVIPDLNHDMHDGSVKAADRWLRKHLGGYAKWAADHHSLLIITFDEDDSRSHNRIPFLITGQGVKPGVYHDKIDHFDVLRTLEAMYGLPFAGKAAKGHLFTDCFQRASADESAHR